MKLLAGVGLLLMLGGTSAYAEGDMDFAREVATILSAETFCGFAYDQQGVTAFIEEKVDAADYSFPTNVNNAGALTRSHEQKMGPAQKTAHCTQIQRIAEHYKFLK